MNKSNLTEKKYWENVHKTKFNFINHKILNGLQKYQFYNILKKYIVDDYKNVFEVGCAPGNYLISFNKYFNLSLNGVDYSDEGIDSIKLNLKRNNLKGNIIRGDFFDKSFLRKNNSKYDIVCSFGFIEHFKDVESVVDSHFELAKKDGLVILAIPNLSVFNRLFFSKRIVDNHNLEIMNIKKLKKIFKEYNVLELRYIGGLFNFGLFTYKNFILEKIRFGLFLFQRLFIDSIFIVLYKIGIDFSNRYTSPQILIICKKK